MKISWGWTCTQIFRKYLDVQKICVILNDVKYSICSSLDLENRLWEIIFTQERAPREAFTYLKSTIETLKKRKIFNVNNKNTRTTFYSFNFEHNSLFFLVSLIWTGKCLLRPTLSIYKCWNNILPQLLTDVQKISKSLKVFFFFFFEKEVHYFNFQYKK